MKKGQVTIFIIVSIVIVGGVLGLIFLAGQKPETLDPSDLGPRDIVRDCVTEILEDSIAKMMKNGGEISPSRAISYNGEEWSYLCYQADYYQGCYNNHPMLELQIENEIERDIAVNLQTCFNLMREDFEDRGFDVRGGGTEYSVDLLPGNVRINIEKNVEIIGSAGSSSFDNFDTQIASPLYDLVRVSREIVNSESQFCNFEYNGYMLLYPKYDIRRFSYMDSTMYRVIDRRSGSEFKFAVRSCAFPPGI